MKNINRRESPRVDIELRCHVTSPALWMRSAMYTENISRSGILIAWRGRDAAVPLPAIGQLLSVEIELPAHHHFGAKCIHCQGTVSRILGADGNCPQVALRVNYMDFRSIRDQISIPDDVESSAICWMT